MNKASLQEQVYGTPYENTIRVRIAILGYEVGVEMYLLLGYVRARKSGYFCHINVNSDKRSPSLQFVQLPPLVTHNRSFHIHLPGKSRLCICISKNNVRG